LTRGNETITDKEAVMFMNLCKYQKLNPFLNEAYLVKFKGSSAQIITSKEAYMKKAERNPNFDGFQAGLIVDRDGTEIEIEGSFIRKGDTLLGGWAKVYRKDRKIPSVARVDLQEYDKKQSTWKEMKKTMIRKAETLLKTGIQKIMLSLGKEGAVFITADEKMKIEPLKLDVKSTVGAGDAMVAGLAYGLENKLKLEETLKTAAACSSATLIKNGTKMGSREDVERLKKMIQIIKI
jgi:phage recombination protein Bet